MKKILFVGKFNTIFKDISNFFDKLFSVQICVDNADMVKGILKLKNPELVVISFIGIGNDAERILREMIYNYPRTPVLCIGTEGELEGFSKSLSSPQFTTLTRPIDNDKILEKMCEILKVSLKDDVIVEDNKEEKKSILLVDDSGIQLRALNDMLKFKYEVRMATSGMQALTLIGKKKPDIIFLDYEMPVCDGRMTLEMIRELEEAKDIPVVFLTGVSDKEHIEAVLRLKPAGYLLKPASSEMIYNILEKLL